MMMENVELPTTTVSKGLTHDLSMNPICALWVPRIGTNETFAEIRNVNTHYGGNALFLLSNRPKS